MRRRRRDLPGSHDVWYSSPFSRLDSNMFFLTVYSVPKLLGISKYVQLYIERIRIQNYYKSESIFGQLFTVNSYISFLPFPGPPLAVPFSFYFPFSFFLLPPPFPSFLLPLTRVSPPLGPFPGSPVSPPGPLLSPTPMVNLQIREEESGGELIF